MEKNKEWDKRGRDIR